MLGSFLNFFRVKTAEMTVDDDVLNKFTDNLFVKVEKVRVIIEEAFSRADELLKFLFERLTLEDDEMFGHFRVPEIFGWFEWAGHGRRVAFIFELLFEDLVQIFYCFDVKGRLSPELVIV